MVMKMDWYLNESLHFAVAAADAAAIVDGLLMAKDE